MSERIDMMLEALHRVLEEKPFEEQPQIDAEACSPSEELYGEARLEELLKTHGGDDSKTIVNAISDAVHQHAAGAEQSDDITVLIVKKA